MQELEAILLEILADLVVLAVQESPRGCSEGPRGFRRQETEASKKVNFGGDGELVDVPNSFQIKTSVNARGSNVVLKKLNWATGQTLTAIGLERGFPQEYPSNGFTAGSK